MADNFNIVTAFWVRYDNADFVNRYTVGIATTAADDDQYAAEGFRRIDRDDALALMSRRAEEGEALFVTVTRDGLEVEDRFMLAREIRREARWLEIVNPSNDQVV